MTTPNQSLPDNTVMIDPPTYDEVIEDVQEVIDEYLDALDEIIESLTEEETE